jgi:hypothetical protein
MIRSAINAMRFRFARALVAAAAVVTASSAQSEKPSASLSVLDAVSLYARGDFDTAVRGLDTRELKVAPFTRALDGWIAAGDPAVAPRRRLVAAAFALDVVWAATRVLKTLDVNHDPWNSSTADAPDRALLMWSVSQPHVAGWAVQQLPATGIPDAAERALWLTAVGIVEDGHSWHRLQREILPLARNRLPGEPRLRLAEVLARTNIDLGSLRAGGLNPRRNEILRPEHLPSSVTGRIPKAIAAFEPLLADADLAGETELRIGYLELRRGQWPGALARFEAARSKTADPFVAAAADYLAGWAHEQRGRPDDAIAAYRRAVKIAPEMRNVATRLSALLYLDNRRAEAFAVLDRALNARPAPIDLLVAVERADARFVPDWLMSIRRTIQ